MGAVPGAQQLATPVDRHIDVGRAVLTNGYTGHVPRAPGFLFLRGLQLAVVK